MFKYSTKNKTAEISFEGTSGIDEAAELKEMIIKVLKNNQKLEVQVAQVEAMDVSILQILSAAQKQCENDNKQFVINTKDAAVFNDILITSGFASCFSKE